MGGIKNTFVEPVIYVPDCTEWKTPMYCVFYLLLVLKVRKKEVWGSLFVEQD